MPTTIRCPACQKALRVRDGLEGTRVQCPGCKHRWVVPGGEEPEEEDEPPRPMRVRQDEDEEEEVRPRRVRARKRSQPRDDFVVSSVPLIYGILSIVLFCIPPAAAGLGYLANTKADEEMARIPGKNRYRGAWKQMQTAKLLGTIGIGLALCMVVLAIVLKIIGK